MDYRKTAVEELKCIDQLRAAEKVCRDRIKELKAALDKLAKVRAAIG
jgi:hypothetical protein